MKANISFDEQIDARCEECGHVMPATELERADGHICPDCGSNSWFVEMDNTYSSINNRE